MRVPITWNAVCDRNNFGAVMLVAHGFGAGIGRCRRQRQWFGEHTNAPARRSTSEDRQEPNSGAPSASRANEKCCDETLSNCD